MQIVPIKTQEQQAVLMYRSQFLGHRFEPYAAAATEGSCF